MYERSGSILKPHSPPRLPFLGNATHIVDSINIRPVNGNHHQRTGKSRVSHDFEDSQIDLDGLNLDEDEGEEIDDYPSSKAPPSAPHSTPLPLLTSPHSRIDINVIVDHDEVDGEMANSMVTDHHGQRQRTTPFSCNMRNPKLIPIKVISDLP
ncbi:hypothetical protein ACTXT7_003058 [Hymenolepis weldensis]